jgi:hypothetical protein
MADSDNKAALLNVMSDSINDLEQQFHDSSVADRVVLRPKLADLLQQYQAFRLRMLQDAETVSLADINQMQQIKAEIDAASEKQQLLAAIAKTAAFIAATA